MDKNVLYTYSRILFSLTKKEFLLHPTTWINLKSIMLSEISQAPKTVCFHLNAVSEVVMLMGTEVEQLL